MDYPKQADCATVDQMTEEKNTFKPDPLDSMPIYRQLASHMRRSISDGIWAPGKLIPSENFISADSGISRTTVRLAFRELFIEGLIIRRRGLGTFVTEPRIQRNLNNLYSFTEDMLKADMKPSSRVLVRKVMQADAELAHGLCVPELTRVFCTKRIRLADGRPILSETTWVPYALCKGIESENLESASLYAVLAEKYGTEPFRATETYEAILVTEQDAADLDVRPGSPAFLITRTGFLRDGTAFEYTESVTPGSRCRFEIGLNGPRTGITLQRGYPDHV